MDLQEPSILGFTLSTHRDKGLGPDAATYFQAEAFIAAISVLFYRTTVTWKDEPLAVRWFFAILLAVLAYMKKSYELIVAVEFFSYAVPYVLLFGGGPKLNVKSYMLSRMIAMAASAILSLLVAHLLVSGKLLHLFQVVAPDFFIKGLGYVFPIEELNNAYNIMVAFADPAVLRKQVSNLFFVTYHIQVGIGFLGINFLQKEQDRKNQLLRMDIYHEDKEDSNGEESNDETSRRTAVMMGRSKKFQSTAAPFIFFTALPYMFQIIFYGNMNKFAFSCLQHDLHRIIRLNELFDHDSHLIAMANDSPISPECKPDFLTR
jgi:hypothetical protein